jgi:molybdopterin converting factor small subunit
VAQASGEPAEIPITVRYFAAARAAAGTESETVAPVPATSRPLRAGEAIDVLPPFAGG